MQNITKTLYLKATVHSERITSLFAHIVKKPVSLLVHTFFAPRIVAAQVVVDDCVVYSTTQNI